jgi:CRP-like cAMP-binding protein
MMRRYARGETVIRQESRGDELFIIKSGRARVELLREGHAPVCVGMLGPGEFFGERGVLTGEPRRASVLAEDELSTIVVPKEAFQEVLARHEHLLTGIGEILSRRSAELDEHASEEDPSSRLSQHDQKAVLVERIRRFFSL